MYRMSCSWGIDTENVVVPSTAKEDLEQERDRSRQKSGVTWTSSPEYARNALDVTPDTPTTPKQKSPPKGKSRTIPPALIPPTVITPVYEPQRHIDRAERNTLEYKSLREDLPLVPKGKSPTKPSPVYEDKHIRRKPEPTREGVIKANTNSFDNLLDAVVEWSLSHEKPQSRW